MRALFLTLLVTISVATQVDGQSPSVSSGGARLPGEFEVRAMAEAYPDRIEEIAVREGEWALRMDGVWYYWAGGRLLPAEQRAFADEFSGVRFYGSYRFGPAVERDISPQLEARLMDGPNRGERDARGRFNGFLDKLYQVSSRSEAEGIMERVEFFGHATRVHPLLVRPLERVEARVREIAEGDEEVRRFLADLREIHGYNWRNIAGTNRRSYHSYGIAVDLLPVSYRGQWAYWLWAAQSGNERWWRVPLSQRWQVPQPVIDAFEEEGFVWGGKWLFFDNMHFEYRPEALILARWKWVYGFPESLLRPSGQPVE